MFENLNQRYHFNNNFKHNMRTIALVTVGFILIVLYFQPFGINFLSASFYGYFVLIGGIITSLLLFLNTIILPGLLPKHYNDQHWTIKKEIYHNLMMTVELAGVFALATSLSNSMGYPRLPLLPTAALSLIPIILLNIITYNAGLKKRVGKAFEEGLHWLQEEKKNIEKQGKKKNNFKLEAENKKDFFEGNITNLVAIGSASNYIEIYFKEGKEIKKKLLRCRFSAAEKCLASFKEVQKSHRCWLVNTSFVNYLKKQSQNYSIVIKGLDFNVPVSRAQSNAFKEQFNVRLS